MTPFKYSICWSLFVMLLVSCTPESNKEENAVTARDYDRLSTDNLDDFRSLQNRNWQIKGSVYMNRLASNQVAPQEGKGILLNLPADGTKEDIVTKSEHADIDLQVDFMLPGGSRSAIYFQGRYGLQLADSWKKDSLTFTDCGGLLQPMNNSQAAGTAPLINACKAPGLWQHLLVKFKAPRFNREGKKITNAWFEQVVLNGKTIQEHVEVPGATFEAAFTDEKELGPLVFQGKHGAIAFRNIQYKSYDEKRITLSGMQYREYKGTYRNYDTLKNFTPIKTGNTDSLSFRLIEKKNQLVVTGTMNVPKDGRYVFQINAAGPGWLFIDDQEVVNNAFNGDFTVPYFSSVELKSGAHPFRCIYNNLYESFVLRYEGPGIPFTTLTTPSSEHSIDFIPPFEYVLQQDPVFQRGFFMHHGKINPYTMSVGFPGGLNYAYDMTACTMLSAWRGKYIDVSNMWTERGESQREIPLGGLVEFAGKPPLSELANADGTWPDTVVIDNNMYGSRAYTIKDNGLPVFQYSYKSDSVSDYISPMPDRSGLRREVTVSGSGSNKYWQLASGRVIEKLPDGAYAIDDKQYYISFDKAGNNHELKIMKKNEAYELLLPLQENVHNLQFSYSIIW